MVTIGVLALQGDVAEHVRALENSGARALLVRRVSELDQVDGLVIPGGESTTMSSAPKERWSSRPSRIDEASMIMPAHVP